MMWQGLVMLSAVENEPAVDEGTKTVCPAGEEHEALILAPVSLPGTSSRFIIGLAAAVTLCAISEPGRVIISETACTQATIIMCLTKRKSTPLRCIVRLPRFKGSDGQFGPISFPVRFS